jgi:hypothetical protein
MSIFHCCNNLQGLSSARLTDDNFDTVQVNHLPTVLLNQDKNRGLIKLYVTSVEPVDTVLWIRYGTGITLQNASHVLPLRHLLIIDTLQAANAISAICSGGIADIRISWALR